MDDYLWPEEGALPFVPDPKDWRRNAWLPREPNWTFYRRGYVQAVEVLVGHVLSGRRDQDFLIYPILFMSRHSVELGLKQTIGLSRAVLGEEAVIPAGHNLASLWETAQSLFEPSIRRRQATCSPWARRLITL